MTRPKHFLVVGDWFVDNYWVCAPQRTEAASRTGERHIRAMHGINSSVRALCGAGEIASLLALAQPQYRVTGIGHWHTGDTEHLRSLLFPALCQGDNPYKVNPAIRVGARIDRSLRDQLKRVTLIPLSSKRPRVCKVGTNRVWRVFEHTLDGYRHRNRIDWIQPDHPEVDHKHLQRIVDQLNEANQEAPVTAVIVKDHMYGAVTRRLVAALAERFGNVPWYVTSKQEDPEWFPELPTDAVKMLLVPKEITAILKDRRGIVVHDWLIDGTAPSRAAMSILDRYADRNEFRSAAIVAEYDYSGALARLPGDDPRGVLVETHRDPEDDAARFVPRASIFFAAAVHYATVAAQQPDWEAVLGQALSFASRWTDSEKGRIQQPETWRGNEECLTDSPPESRPYERRQGFNWAHATGQWEAAHEKQGIIKLKGGGRKLELWRSMTEVRSLIAISSARRKLISELGIELAAFKRGNREHSRSFYIGDRPGFGKSRLVSVLAAQYGYALVEINVTELHTADDLWEYFHRIVSKSQEDSRKPILVFVDEANAQVQQQHVYSWFLKPLEDRKFHTQKETFVLPACVWIFAGTERLPSSVRLWPVHAA